MNEERQSEVKVVMDLSVVGGVLSEKSIAVRPAHRLRFVKKVKNNILTKLTDLMKIEKTLFGPDLVT